jgi:hypothetical protein
MRWISFTVLAASALTLSSCPGPGLCDNGLGPCNSDEECRDSCDGQCQLTGLACDEETTCSDLEGVCVGGCTCQEDDPACEEGRRCSTDTECGQGTCDLRSCDVPGHGAECQSDSECTNVCDGVCRVSGLACPWDSGCSEHGSCIVF